MRLKQVCWAFASVSFCMNVSAQAEAIATDRPDFVESSDVVGAGRVQVETGVSMDRDDADGISIRAYTTPTLLRIGMSETIELRVETDGRAVVKTETPLGEETVRGWSDVSLGFKWHVNDNAGASPGVAVLVHVDVDSGSREFRGSELRPSIRVVGEWELPGDMSLGVMPGVVYNHNGDDRFVSGIFAVTVGKQWSEKFRNFVEVSGQQIAHAEDGGNVVTFDAGVTYLVTDDVQLDAAVSRGLNDNTPDWTFGGGLSVRF